MSSKNYSYVLFDLDGTLTDSGPGIMNGFTYAIKKMGKEVPGRDILQKFVGPPLSDSFENVLGFSPEDTEKGILLYREYYNKLGGALENSVYPGIYDLLKKLKSENKTIMVATSKSLQATNTVLEHFGLRDYFDFIATPDGADIITKTDVINLILEEYKIKDKSSAVMVGDRHYDITAARNLGMDSIGVLYGYGSRKELEEAGATYLAEKPDDIAEIVL